MLQSWRNRGTDDLELTRRLIDLFFVSVLLDAGAGDHWSYTEHKTDRTYERSEGIAVASLHMFNAFAFKTIQSGDIPMVDGNRPWSSKSPCSLIQVAPREGSGAADNECTKVRLSSVGREPNVRS